MASLIVRTDCIQIWLEFSSPGRLVGPKINEQECRRLLNERDRCCAKD